MEWIEVIYGVVLICLSFFVIKSDIKEGLIYNKTLLIFAVIAMILDGIYYGFLFRDYFAIFVFNIIIITMISLCLFYIHALAGGDCKLIIVMALLYPARWCFAYNGNTFSLFFAIGFAILYGYIYLLVSSAGKLLQGKNKLTLEYVRGYLISFVRSFVTALVYISAANLILSMLLQNAWQGKTWIIRIICIAIAWLVGRFPFFRKNYMLCAIIFVDVLLCLLLRTIPFSIYPENYILVLLLLLCQMTIRTGLYEEVAINNLQKGMILSAASSMQMQGSRVRGLPPVSSEDLRSRLSDEEISGIKRWAISRQISSVVVVKKIPFAIFIVLGFLSCFLIWSIGV